MQGNRGTAFRRLLPWSLLAFTILAPPPLSLAGQVIDSEGLGGGETLGGTGVYPCPITPTTSCADSSEYWECPADPPTCSNGVCVEEVRVNRFLWDSQYENVYAKLYWPENHEYNSMGLVFVHGGLCTGIYGAAEHAISENLAKNGWVVLNPRFRGWNADRNTGDPGHCDIGCNELLDIHAAACYLKNKFNNCSEPSEPCPEGNCIIPELVSGWGHSGGGGRLPLAVIYFPQDFRRIALTSAFVDLASNYGNLSDKDKGLVDAILNLESPPPGVDPSEILEERSPRQRYDDIVDSQAPGSLGDQHLTGIIAAHGLRDKTAPLFYLDAFLNNLDDYHRGRYRYDPAHGITTEKFIYCQNDHPFLAPNDALFDAERAFEAVNHIVRFLKDGTPEEGPSRAMPLKVRAGGAIGLPGPYWYRFKTVVWNHSSEPRTVAAVQRIYALGDNCMVNGGQDDDTYAIPRRVCRVADDAYACTDGEDCNTQEDACYPCNPCDPIKVTQDPQFKLIPPNGSKVWTLNVNLRKWMDTSPVTNPGGEASPPLRWVRHDVIVRDTATGCFTVGDDEYYDPTAATPHGSSPDAPACNIRGASSIRTFLKDGYNRLLVQATDLPAIEEMFGPSE